MDTDVMLHERFAELDDPVPRTPAADIRALAHRRRAARRTRWMAAAAAVVILGGAAAGVLLLARPGGTGPGPGPGRWRGAGGLGGTGGAGDTVQLGVAIEGNTGLVTHGDTTVDAGETVVFHVTVDHDGFLCLQEQSEQGWAAVYPVRGEAWIVTAGTHWPGGGQPLSFRTDRGDGTREYRVLFDPDDAGCGSHTAEDHVVIDWEGAAR